MKLLEPIKVGNVVFKNRIMFPPLTTGYEERDGSIGKQSLSFYKRLAEGGVGYIVIGDVVPVNTMSPTPKLFMDSQMESFKRLAEALHEYDCKLGLQIFHPEYDAEALIQMMKEGKTKEEVFQKLHYDMLHFINEATQEQLTTILNRITVCVSRAIRAGVDVIEVHGDRLVGSLCSPILNKRTDTYGGSFENRIRFALEVVDSIKKASSTITIDYKLPILTKQEDGTLLGKGGLCLEEAIELAKILEQKGVHTLHVAQANHTGNMNDTIPAMGTRPYVFMKEECKAIKDVVSIPVSTVGRIIDVDMAESLLQNGICDMVAFGRPLLADPDIAVKLEKGKKNQIRHCIMCNKGCTDAIMGRRFISCVLNAENGYEYNRVIQPAKKKHKIAIVGAGIAGLEAARIAKIKGHDVTVFEASNTLYGQIKVASLPPRKEEMERIYSYYDEMISVLKIDIQLNHPFTKKDANGFDDILVAIGAKNSTPPIPGIEYTLDAWEVLKNPNLVQGKVLIAGGGLVGVETAEFLATRGYSVSIVEMTDTIAKEESKTILPTLWKEFEKNKVTTYVLHKIIKFEKNGVFVQVTDSKGNPLEDKFISADTIIRALSSKKNTLDLSNISANILYIGDCALNQPCTIEHAIKSAYDAANSIGNEE